MQERPTDWDPASAAERLLADALAAAPEAQWPDAVDRLCAEHPIEEQTLRRLFSRMRAAGLVREPDRREPATVGGYQLRRRLGIGGMGIVYEAEQALTGRLVALKLVRPELLESETARRRFHREVELAASLDHPNICTIYEAGTADGQPFLAMQLVTGVSLAVRIATARLPQAEAIAIVEKLARALHTAHEAGLVHRDVKPGNVILRPDGEPVLVDFGLARAIDQEQSNLTLTGEVVGTPAYLAPEQIEGRAGSIDRRTDVYALGVTLHELVTGCLPFAAPTRDALYRRILAGDRTNTPWTKSGSSRDLRAIVETAIDHDPHRRYATALDLAEDLARLRRHEPIRARRAGPMLRLVRWSQRNRAAAALLVVLSAALGIVAWSLQQASLSLAESHQRQLVLASFEAGRSDPILALHLARHAARQQANFAAVTQLAAAVRACNEELSLDLPFRSGALEVAFGRHGEFWCRGNDENKNPVALLVRWTPAAGMESLATPGPVLDLAVHGPDDRVVIIVKDGGVHELARDRNSWVRVGEVEGARCLCFARDGTLFLAAKDGLLITATADGTFASRTIAAGAQPIVLEQHADRDLLLVGTQDGRVLAVQPATGDVREFRVNTDPQQPTQAVHAIRTCPGSPWIAAQGRQTQHIAAWNLDDPAFASQRFGGGGRGDPISCFAIVGDRLATGHRDQQVRIHSLTSSQALSLTGPTGWVMRIDTSPDQRLLAACCGDGTALVWDLASGKIVHRVQGAGSSPSLVAFDPSGRRLMIGLNRGPLRVYTVQHEHTPRLRWHRAGVRWCLALPASAPFALVTAAADGSMNGWAGSREPVAFGGTGRELITGASVLPADALIATVGTDAQLRLWDYDGEPASAPMDVPEATSQWSRAVSLGKGQLLLVAAEPHRWWCFAKDDGAAWAASTLPEGLPDPATVWGLVSSPDGRELLVGHGNGTATHLVREGVGFRVQHVLEHAPGTAPGGCYVEHVAIATGGQRFLTTGTDRAARLWDREGRPLAELTGHEEVFAAVAFSPDGERIATLSADEVWLWDRAGKPLFRIQTDGGAFAHCVFLADSRRLAITSTDGSVWVEPVVVGDIVTEARRRQTRAITPEVLAPYAELLGSEGAAASRR